MLEERKTAKCPMCGDESVLTTWKPPKGLDQRFRQYKCSNLACQARFYMAGVYHTDDKKPSDENRGLLSLIE